MAKRGIETVSGAHLRGIRGISQWRVSLKFSPPEKKIKKRLYLQPLRLLLLRHRDAKGEMAEWSIAAVLKTVVRATGPGVRIPLSPQSTEMPALTCRGWFLFYGAQ